MITLPDTRFIGTKIIYYLKGIDTGEVFYVGCTGGDLRIRLQSHIHSSNRGRFPVHDKIRSLNKRVSIHELAKITANSYDFPFLEQAYINRLSKKHKLTNSLIF